MALPAPVSPPKKVYRYHAYPGTCRVTATIGAAVTLLGFIACVAVGISENVRVNAEDIIVNAIQLANSENYAGVRTITKNIYYTSVKNSILYIFLAILPFCYGFSLALCGGVEEKNPKLLKSYCNFGTSISASITVLSICLIRAQAGMGPWYAYLALGFIIVVYLPILTLVYSTYKAYEAPASPDTDSTSAATQQGNNKDHV